MPATSRLLTEDFLDGNLRSNSSSYTLVGPRRRPPPIRCRSCEASLGDLTVPKESRHLDTDKNSPAALDVYCNWRATDFVLALAARSRRCRFPWHRECGA